MARNDIVTRVTAKDDTKAGLRSARSSFKTFAKDAKTITTGVVGGELISAAGRAAMDTARQFFREGIAFTRALETTGAQMRTLLGSQGMAQQQLDFIKRFAADTPFFIQQVADANRLLVQFTGSAVEANEAMNLVGDAAAGSGADVANVALWWGRLVDGLKNNRPVGEALSRLQELGIVNGETRGRVEELVEAERGLEAQQYVTARVTDTFSGAMSRLRDTIGGALDTAQNAKEELLAMALEISGVTDALKTGADGWTVWANRATQALNEVMNHGFFTRNRMVIQAMLAAAMNPYADFGQALTAIAAGNPLSPDEWASAQQEGGRGMGGFFANATQIAPLRAPAGGGAAVPVEVVKVSIPTHERDTFFRQTGTGGYEQFIDVPPRGRGPLGTAMDLPHAMGFPDMRESITVPIMDAGEEAHKDALTANQLASGILSGVTNLVGLYRAGASGSAVVGSMLGTLGQFLPPPFNFIFGGAGGLLSAFSTPGDPEASRRSFNPQGDRCESFVVTSPGPNTLRINHGQNTYNVVVSMDPDALDRRIGDSLAAA